jgi:hypothetical protein
VDKCAKVAVMKKPSENLKAFVPKVGIEPTHPKVHDFESCASTSSAILASGHLQSFILGLARLPAEVLRRQVYQFRHFGLFWAEINRVANINEKA